MIKRLFLILLILYSSLVCLAQSVDKLLATQVAWANHIQQEQTINVLQQQILQISNEKQ